MVTQLKRLLRRDGLFLFTLSIIVALVTGIYAFSEIVLQNTHIPTFINVAISIAWYICYLGLLALMVGSSVAFPLKKKWKFVIIFFVLSTLVSNGISFLVNGVLPSVSVDTGMVVASLSLILTHTFCFVLLSILWGSCWNSKYSYSVNGWRKVLISCLLGSVLSALVVLSAPVLDRIVLSSANYLARLYKLLYLWMDSEPLKFMQLLFCCRSVITQVALFIGMTGIIYLLSAWSLAQHNEDWEDDDDEKPFQMSPLKTRITILSCVLTVVCIGSLVYLINKEHRSLQQRIAEEAQRLEQQQTKEMEAKIVKALNKYQIKIDNRRGTIDFHMKRSSERACQALADAGASYEMLRWGCYYEISDWTVSRIENSSAYVARKVRKGRNVLNGEEVITTRKYIINPEIHTIAATDGISCGLLQPTMETEMLIREQADAERYIRECSRNDFYVE